ncbi:MAG TPA: hydroxyisourate hydrolase [Vicinamibacterales bacterium]|nr:hydroxyisourate hydrolase [Vicinamibacterales bacterium]
MAITTHVLDTMNGRPAAGVSVELLQSDGSGWRSVGRGATDADGRLRTLLPEAPVPGVYRLRFDTGGYFGGRGLRGFYPEVLITFEVAEGNAHYHVPLLLSPFGYSTYRGS